jgi:putative heme transporter
VAADERDANGVPAWLVTAGAIAWRVLAVTAVAVLIVAAAVQLAIVTVPIILALVLATLAAPPARGLERLGLPPVIAALLVVVGGLLALVGVVVALAPSFVSQAQELGPTVVQAWEDILVWLEDGPLGVDRSQVEGWISDGLAAIQGQAGELVGSAVDVVTQTIEAVAALILSLVLLFFVVKDGDTIAAWLLARVPDEHRSLVQASGQRGWESLAGYVRGTATVALIDAVGIGIGLLILGVPLVLPLSVLVFFGGFIPVVGAFVTGLLAVLVALADGGPTTALLVLGVVIVVQQVESDVLQPMIMRRVVPLHPVVVLIVLAAGAKLVGLIGALLAVPIAAVVSAVGNEVRLRHRHLGDPGPEPLGGPSADDDD